MDTLSIKSKIRQQAFDIGFSKCGFAVSRCLTSDFEHYMKQIALGFHADMLYLDKEAEKRFHPLLVHPDIRTVIVLLAGYKTNARQKDGAFYSISDYALIPDYHKIMKEGLQKLSCFIENEFHSDVLINFVDTGHISEKAWAREAGLGNFGKNSILLTPEGSYFFIGVILTDLVIIPDEAFDEDLCKNCDLCIKSCPTQAIHQPYAVDARLCISYHTIENKGHIPSNIIEKIGTQIYGCDICQKVCPWNRHQTVNSVLFSPLPPLLDMKAEDFESVTETDFRERFHESPMVRLGHRRYMRNIEAVKNMAATERKRPY